MKDLFEKLNKPFKYEDYMYDSDNNLTYIKGQVIFERLNEVLGVGYWKYSPITETTETIDTGKENKAGKVSAKSILVKFEFYNTDLKEWVAITDAGYQEMNKKMNDGDAVKSSITDGVKKCASRIGLASDLYAGRIKAVNGKVVLPASYKAYYDEMGWEGVFEGEKPQKEVAYTKEEQGHKKISQANIKTLFAAAGKDEIVREVIAKHGYSSTKDILIDDYPKIKVEVEKLARQEKAHEGLFGKKDIDSLLDTVIDIGEHKGKTIREVKELKPEWIAWYSQEGFKKELKEKCQEILKLQVAK